MVIFTIVTVFLTGLLAMCSSTLPFSLHLVNMKYFFEGMISLKPYSQPDMYTYRAIRSS